MSNSADFDLGELIEQTPGVYGGRPCLAGTRFPVLQVAVLWRSGMSPEAIVGEYEGLTLAKVYAGVAYYLANREAIDAELEEERRLYNELLEADRRSRERASA